MRRIFLLFVMFAFSIVSIFAQRTVTGTVTNETGDGIPGVTVIAKGTNEATISDLSGGYSFSVPEGTTKLIFSYPGFVDEERKVANVVNVQMKSDTDLEEVVVTALGVKRDVKALGYSATSVKSDELTRTSDRSALNALQGKVAGVNISSASGAPGSSTRVVMRGFSSISGSNQPLYIIDGVPLNNTQSGSTSINGGTDFGNGVNDINPDDIESMSILKGASGVALYGSRAANGVIIITTKKGRQHKTSGLEVSVTSSMDLSSVLRLPNWQNEYGQGFFGARDIRENTSWGPKFDDVDRYWDYTLKDKDISARRRIKPYSALPDNVLDFFDIGKTYNNSISFAGGGEKTSFYMSYSNINDDGIMPQDHDTYDRHAVSVRGQSKLTNKITASGSMNYIKKQGEFVMTGQGAVSVYNQILQIPRDIPIVELEDYTTTWDDLDNYYSPYNINPYLALNEFKTFNNQERVFGNVQMNYEINEFLRVTYRIGTDVTNEQRDQSQPILDPHHISGSASSWVNSNEGSVSSSARLRREINSDLILSFNNKFGDNIDYSILVGNNINQRNYKTQYMSIDELSIPGWYNVRNNVNDPYVYEGESLRRLIGVFGQLDMNFYKMVYLSFQSRNDWSSTLPTKNNSFYYPGVNIAFDFTEAFPVIKSILSFGKVRVGWAQTGNDADPYKVFPTMVGTVFSDGYEGTGLSFPLPSGVTSYAISNGIANPDLEPEISTEIEFGADLRFFKGRVNLDFSYYDRVTDNQILATQFVPSSGYSYQTVNFGSVQNKGIEFLLEVQAIKKENFQWGLSFNYTKNDNILLSLPDGTEEITFTGVGMPATGYTSMKAIVGQPLGVITVNDVQRVTDESSPYYGSIIVDKNDGLPKPDISKEIIVGKTPYDYIMGIGTSLNYKGIGLNMNFDIRQGGVMYSRTAEMTYFSGTNQETLYNDRQPFIPENTVVEVLDDDDYVIGYQESVTPIINDGTSANMHSYWGGGATELNKKFVIDKSFVKFRNVSLSYNFPKKMLSKIFIGSAKLSVYGRNLLIWTPEDNQWIDPEATSFGNDITADYGEWGTTPSIRTVGVSLKFTF